MNRIVLVLAGLMCASALWAQVGINATGASPDPSSMLDVSSSDKGVLVSRMSQIDRDLIANPAFGLLIFNTTTGCLNIWVGSTWRQVCGACDFNDPVAGNNGPICAGGTLNLTATTIPGASYSWTGPNGFSSDEQNPSIPESQVGASGSYSVVATLNGCSSQPQSTVATVNAIPATPTAAASPNPVCGNTTLNLSATTISGASYLWTGPSGFSSTVQNPQIQSVALNQSGAFSVTASLSGCTSAPGSVNVTVNDPVPATPGVITGVAATCEFTTNLTYSVALVSGASQYNWNVPTGASITSGDGTNSITVTMGSQSGIISVSAANNCGASGVSELSVTVYPIPAATFTYSTPTANIPVVFTPDAGGGSYNWTFQGGSPASSAVATPSVTWSTGGLYTVGLNLTVNGCSNSGNTNVTIVGGPYNFSTCAQSGRFGPSQSQCNSAYSTTELEGNVTVTNGIQFWTVPSTGTYRIETWGARSGWDNSGGNDSGKGARMRGDFALTQGQVLKVLVGQVGGNNSSSSAGGGGGTFVAFSDNTPLIVAGGGGALEGSGGPFSNQHGTTAINGQSGGGGGCAQFAGGVNCNGATQDDADNHGGGGAGFCTDGVGVGNGSTHYTPARAFLNGGAGGEAYNNNVFGGFGGGGGAWGNGGGSGGGGGYSGGGSGDNCGNAYAGGGGSFNDGTDQSNTTGTNDGPGAVSITFVGL